MSQVLSKAQELADAISVSDELAGLRQAAERLDGDEAANLALRQLQEKQQVAQRAASSGIQLPDEQMDELKAIQERIRSFPAVQEFATAQSSFNGLMDQVNDIIAAAVTGRKADEADDGCGPGCNCGN